MSEQKPAVLLLEDGTVFNGIAIGKIGTTTGEIAFNTGMTGYQEVFTDPSYYGQILCMTAAHIGNYGVHKDEIESEGMKIAGIVIKKFSDGYSRPSGMKSLQDYMVDDSKVGIADVDTRALVRHIRSKGAMNALISSEDKSIDELKKELAAVPSMAGLELSSKVTTSEPYFYGDENAELKVALVDFGVKRSIATCLADRGCYVKVFPMDTTLDELNAFDPDGFMLFLGTMFAPTKDRGVKGEGFTHKTGDRVSISSADIGLLHNQMKLSADCQPWTFGLADLMRNLSARGLV